MFWVESVYQHLVGDSVRQALAQHLLHCGSNGGRTAGDNTTCRQETMGKDHDASSGSTATSLGDLPEFPGSDFLAHHATTWLENATLRSDTVHIGLPTMWHVLSIHSAGERVGTCVVCSAYHVYWTRARYLSTLCQHRLAHPPAGPSLSPRASPQSR